MSAANAGKLGADFIHRQTMAGAMRFTTAELAELESKIASAAERALALELRLFDDLVGEVMARRAARSPRPPRRSPASISPPRSPSARSRALGCGPSSTDGAEFAISGGRHPTVEAALAGSGRLRRQ